MNQDALLLCAQAKIGIAKPSHGHIVLQNRAPVESTSMLSNYYVRADSVVPAAQGSPCTLTL